MQMFLVGLLVGALLVVGLGLLLVEHKAEVKSKVDEVKGDATEVLSGAKKVEEDVKTTLDDLKK